MKDDRQQETVANVFRRYDRMVAERRPIAQFRLRPADWDEVIAATVHRNHPWTLYPPPMGSHLSPDPMLLGYPLVVDPDAPPLSDEQP